MEDVLKLNPDVILISSFFRTCYRAILYDAAVWQMIPAVRARKVYLIPEMLQNTVFLLDPLLHQWLAEVLHQEVSRPAVMPSVGAGLRMLYRDVYHYDLSDTQINDTLFAKENAQSAGYQRILTDAAPSSTVASLAPSEATNCAP